MASGVAPSCAGPSRRFTQTAHGQGRAAGGQPHFQAPSRAGRRDPSAPLTVTFAHPSCGEGRLLSAPGCGPEATGGACVPSLTGGVPTSKAAGRGGHGYRSSSCRAATVTLIQANSQVRYTLWARGQHRNIHRDTRGGTCRYMSPSLLSALCSDRGVWSRGLGLRQARLQVPLLSVSSTGTRHLTRAHRV